jgi:hypothetical protein
MHLRQVNETWVVCSRRPAQIESKVSIYLFFTRFPGLFHPPTFRVPGPDLSWAMQDDLLVA